MAKSKKKKNEEIVQTNLTFQELMKKALNTPLPNKGEKKKKAK